jgi:hypothetical protein
MAFGAIEPIDARSLRARFDGRELSVTFEDTTWPSRGGQRRTPFGLTNIRVPLSRPLPIIVVVENRQGYMHVGSTPEVRTGDPAFDARFFVFGTPPEVVAAALDAPTRSWIATMGENPTVRLEDSWVISHWSTPGVEGRTAPADLLQAARSQIRMADACVAAFDAHHQAIGRERGAAAADAWHAAAVAGVARRAEDATRIRRIFIAGCAIGVLVLVGVGLLVTIGVLTLVV